MLAAGCSRSEKKAEDREQPAAPSVSALLGGDGPGAVPGAGEALPSGPGAAGESGENPFVRPPGPAPPAPTKEGTVSGTPPGGKAQPLLPGAAPGATPAGVPLERDAEKAMKQVRMPVYPGAKTEEGALMGDPPGAKPGTFRASMVRVSTQDPFEKVLGFYRQKMPGAHVEEAKREGRRQAFLALPDRKTGEMQMAQIIETQARVQVLLSRAKTPPPPKPEDLPFKVDRDADAALKRVALPVYPGAKVEGGATETDRKNPAVSRAAVVLVSDDDPSRLLEFYKKELPGAASDEREIEGTKVYRLIRQDAATGGGVSVTVASVEGRTRCALMRVTLPPAKKKE